MILCVCPNPSVDKFAWIENFTPGMVHRIINEQHFPGGKGIHVAMAIKELGEEVALLGFWAGPTGEWLRMQCQEMGILTYGPEVSGWSRICTTFRSDNNYNNTELIGYGPALNDEDITAFKVSFQSLIGDATSIAMSGSWPQGSRDNEYAELINIAHQHQKPVFLDCSGQQLLNALKEKPYAIHLNHTEGKVALQQELPQGIAIRLLQYCEYAAITAGEEGLYLAHKNELIHAKCPVEKVYSTVGCGDCLVGGLAWAHRQGLDILQTARMATACGSANCMCPELGMLYKHDVDKLLDQVMLQHLT
jgi:1-phosphofructokinase family hexose kinase